MKIILIARVIEGLVRSFREYLIEINGVAERTCQSRVFYAREFLVAQGQRSGRRGNRKPLTLNAQTWSGYILRRSRRDSPSRLQAVGAALRSFCRFLCASGRTTQDWSPSVPRIGSPRRSASLDYLRAGQIDQLLSSIDRRRTAGLRNYAILLCLVRLGLRAGEVAQLKLEQVDWRAGRIRLGPGKSRRERELPLPNDVGRALVKYLQVSAERSSSRFLFGGLSSTAVSIMASRALRRAGISTPRPGAHVLRRTLASQLVQRGASLKAVADLLGHRQLDTTRLYAGVSGPMLREVARPWPKEVQL